MSYCVLFCWGTFCPGIHTNLFSDTHQPSNHKVADLETSKIVFFFKAEGFFEAQGPCVCILVTFKELKNKKAKCTFFFMSNTSNCTLNSQKTTQNNSPFSVNLHKSVAQSATYYDLFNHSFFAHCTLESLCLPMASICQPLDGE